MSVQSWYLPEAARRTRGSRVIAWLVVGGLVVAFFVGGALGPMLHPQPLAPDGLPVRILVHDRHYSNGGVLSPDQVAALPRPWTDLGAVGPDHSRVFVPWAADVVPGSAPTGILVETAQGTYVEFGLVGGP